MKKGELYLIPNALSEGSLQKVIPQGIIPQITSLRYFIVENIRTSRRYLKKLDPDISIDDIQFFEMGKHANDEDLQITLRLLGKGQDVGVISDAGCPGVADPGSEIVSRAHQAGIRVIPWVGPSSILMALMASGLNGQQFSFHGYLAKDKKARFDQLKYFSQSITQRGDTHIFMDTPFRNSSLYADVLQACPGQIRLCIAKDITGSKEWIKTLSLSEWKKQKPDIDKIPVIFVLGH